MINLSWKKKDGTSNSVKVPNTGAYAVTIGGLGALFGLIAGAIAGFCQDIKENFSSKAAGK